MYVGAVPGSQQSNSSLYHHNYASSPQSLQLRVGSIQSPQSDHSLLTDINQVVPSPTSPTMYEHDLYGGRAPLTSCGSEDPLSPNIDFDLKPQFETNDQSLSSIILSTDNDYTEVLQTELNWASSNMSMKLEEAFQESKNSDILQGPTLAALNFEHSLSVPGFIEDLDSDSLLNENAFKDIQVPVNKIKEEKADPNTNVAVKPVASKPQWNTTQLLTAFLTRPALRSLSSQTSPNKSSATVSSPTINDPSTCEQIETKLLLSSGSTAVSGTFTLPLKTSGVPIACHPGVNNNNISTMLNNIEQAKMMVSDKSALEELLTRSCEPPSVGCVSAECVTVKSEPSLLPSSCSEQASLTTLTPVKTTLKRALSPGASSNSSNGSMDRKWQEIKEFIYNDELQQQQQQQAFPTTQHHTPAKKIKTEPEDVAYNPKENVDVSDDEDEDDSDSADDALSDVESIGSDFNDDLLPSNKRERRFFWQYNTQAKGPKGKRLCKSVNTADPHVLATFEDPVFDPDLNQSQYKHNGKARRGDGNDITPSPAKLFSIGNELKKLNRIINDMMPPSELPSGVRPKTRKEKNKLASRACRLKKKAQHEANKVKLYGLEQEHQKLMQVIEKIKWDISLRLENPDRYAGMEKLSVKFDKLIKKYLNKMIAGNTTEFVNTVLVKVTNGDKSGGLDK